ncbi:hypothetical protein [Halorussus ruber]|uniref:hypothetical protein n=1 Tax=Halorussus ruber TaxID=1126238 RepID=UPI00143DDF06|nr:hypothetical protein [Halorussus ruber]
MKRVGRDGFNRAQLGDAATVADTGDRLYVSDVATQSDWSGSSEITTFDFAETYSTYP